MKFASPEAHFGDVWGPLVFHIIFFPLPLSGGSPDITEILFSDMEFKIEVIISNPCI